MYYDHVLANAVRKTIQCLKEGSYEAAGGTLFYLWENIENDIGDLQVRRQVTELVNKATALVIAEDPYDGWEELNVYHLDESGLEEALSYLEEMLKIIS